MNCPKHPHEKMTLLFTSYVCDVCDPPKKVIPNPTLTIDVDMSVLTRDIVQPNHVSNGIGWTQATFGAAATTVQASINRHITCVDFRDAAGKMYYVDIENYGLDFSLYSRPDGLRLGGCVSHNSKTLIDDCVQILQNIFGPSGLCSHATIGNIRNAMRWIMNQKGW